MSSTNRQVINDNWNSLIDDLQGDVILDSKSILTEDEFETINNLVSCFVYNAIHNLNTFLVTALQC